MMRDFTCKCLSETADGLRDGLSHFSGPSRVAVLFTLAGDDPVFIYDPQSLLSGHEPRFKELFLDNQAWKTPLRPLNLQTGRFHMIAEKNLQLAGLISQGGRSNSVLYQMWFTEHHPDMCAVGPTERWLEHAAWRFSHDMASSPDLYTGISGSFLREYATHAVRDFIVDEMNVALGWDSMLRIYPILDTILNIGNMREEGAWPWGRLVFMESTALDSVHFVARFPESDQPGIENTKHVRKLLFAVENCNHQLISQGRTIVGISDDTLREFCIMADFRGRHGFIRLNGSPICSFSDGAYRSTTHRAKLVQVEEILLESDLNADLGNALFQIVCHLVHAAENKKFGCTLIVDLNKQPVPLSGQRLIEPIDLRQKNYLALAKSLAQVDGALHLGRDLKLHSFACLLDGRAISGEDRARGARFNSALRFTAEHPNLIVVVVSADRPVSIIQEGVEISAQCQWRPVSSRYAELQRIEDWVNGSHEPPL